MSENSYRSLNDILSIVNNNIPESVTLEYKGSKILSDKRISAICKAVTSLANSAGGQFVVGVQSQGEKPTHLDGGVDGPSMRDWIHKIINTNTFPPVESMEIIEIADVGGTYYVIDVPVSPRAPHQSDDNRYYKRRGPHSEPMEHYEIEDVRNRPKEALAPLRVELFAQDIFAFMRIKNTHPSGSLKNISISIDSNFELKSAGIETLKSRGIRKLHPQVDRYFRIGTFMDVLGENSEAELHVSVSYNFRDRVLSDSDSFYFADYMNSSIVTSSTVNAINGLGNSVKDLSNHMQNFQKNIKNLSENIADGTGLRLSYRTLRALQKADQRLDPYEFGWDGYKIILEISNDEAMALDDIFGVIDSNENKRKRYQELDSDLREKFESYFKVPFD